MRSLVSGQQFFFLFLSSARTCDTAHTRSRGDTPVAALLEPIDARIALNNRQRARILTRRPNKHVHRYEAVAKQ